jgi:glycerol kinase
MTFLAVDQGTTSTRAVLVGEDGSARVIFSRDHAQSYPAPGQVEHDATELLAHVRTAFEAGAAAGAVAAGLANQGETCLGWDAQTGVPVGPAIVWQDDRTAAALARLGPEAEALVRARAGLPLDPYFSASKLALIAAIPEADRLRDAGRLRLGTTDAYFRDRLAGRFETDPTTASRTSLMRLDRLDWDPELCALFGVPIECLPAIRPSTGDLGQVGGLRLAASVVDQQAALFGHGCRRAGDAKITFGTGAFALALTDRLPADTGGVLPTVAWAEAGQAPVYALDGGVYAASAAVNWARGLGLFRDYAGIDGFDGPPAIARGLAFVPALAGLAAPHWDRRARGAWMGMELASGPADLMRALLEGVAFRTAEVLAEMTKAQPLGTRISVDGGMSANGYFLQFLADALGREVAVAGTPELTAVGVAALAAQGIGERIVTPPHARVIAPRPLAPEWTEAFAAARDAVQRYGAARQAQSTSTSTSSAAADRVT